MKSAKSTDLYQEVTNRIIKMIESNQGVLKSLWTNKDHSGMLPANYSSKKQYSGVNILLLWDQAMKQGFNSNYWLTFKQAIDLGGNVRKGEKGTQCIFFG